jgi:hypothetical protein
LEASSFVKRVRLFLVAFFALPMLLVATAPVSAQTTVADCQATIASLSTSTRNTTFIGQNAAKDQAGLQAKLTSASTKLDYGKFADAPLQDLNQFVNKIASVNGPGKIAPADAETLTAGANAAITRVQNLIEGV